MHCLLHFHFRLIMEQRGDRKSATGIVIQQRVKKGYEDLQAILSSTSVDGITEKSTRLDRALNATRDLYAVASRLEDANSILISCAALLTNFEASARQREVMSANLKNLILPLNASATQLLRKAAVAAAPIGGCGKHHSDCETLLKRKVEEKLSKTWTRSSWTSVPMARIATHLSQDDDDAKKIKIVTPRPKKKPKRYECESPVPTTNQAVSLPAPANKESMVYTKSEAVNIILTTTKPHTTERGQTITEMIKMKYVPTSVWTVRRLLKKA